MKIGHIQTYNRAKRKAWNIWVWKYVIVMNVNNLHDHQQSHNDDDDDDDLYIIGAVCPSQKSLFQSWAPRSV